MDLLRLAHCHGMPSSVFESRSHGCGRQEGKDFPSSGVNDREALHRENNPRDEYAPTLTTCWEFGRFGLPRGRRRDQTYGSVVTKTGLILPIRLFIAGLPLEGEILDIAKVGILEASLLAAEIGVSVLLWALPAQQTSED